jgi:uncharacterized protein
VSELLLLVPAGALVGVVLGSVGGGGSLLAVPALVYLGDQSVRAAQVGSLIVVMAAAALAVVPFLRRDEVRWRAGLAFAAAAAIGSLATSLLSRHLDPDLLLLAFSPVMVAGAVAMLREQASAPSTFRRWRHGVSRRAASEVVLLGFTVGSLAGLFGVGGGFVVVPALVVGLGFGVAEAIGTSLLVIILASAPALGERLGTSAPDWSVVGPFLLAAALGVAIGARLARRGSTRALTRWFALLVVATAIFTAAEATVALL